MTAAPLSLRARRLLEACDVLFPEPLGRARISAPIYAPNYAEVEADEIFTRAIPWDSGQRREEA
jgi:hypothetical protein